MTEWRSAIVDADATSIRVSGYDIRELIAKGTFASHVFLLYRGRWPTPAEARVLDALLIAVADHGAGAPSCTAARVAASGNRGSLTAAVAAGVLAIGDEHGGAGEQAMRIIQQMLARRGSTNESLEVIATDVVNSMTREGRRVPGFGHRLHTTDPRVETLYEVTSEAGLAGDGIDCVRALGKAVQARAETAVPTNIDGAVAALLHDLGFEPPAGKLVFVVGRVAGITAEVAEEHAREKPMRIKMPVHYDGPAPRALEDTSSEDS